VSDFAVAEWQRARHALASAGQLVGTDNDSAASRAFYAAFHALTALFALRGQSFSKHSALRAALHRDLILTGQWPAALGSAYDLLTDLRETGDYGGLTRVSVESAQIALHKAQDILIAVEQACPELRRADR